MEYLITLIHGTFAEKAPWTKENSFFCNSIRQCLSPNEVTFLRHNWSGKNSHFARLKESDLLAEKLRKQIIDAPEKKKIIIAHSHGGNIALYALKQLANENSKFDLVTLATPFLNSEKRNFIKNLRIHFYLIPIIFGFLFSLILYKIFLSSSEEMSSLNYLIRMCVILQVSIFFGVGVNEMAKEKILKLPKKINHISEKTKFTNYSFHNNILAVIDYSDEIKIWFGSLIYVWEGILRIHTFLCRVFLPLFYITMILITVMIILIFMEIFYSKGYSELFGLIYHYTTNSFILLSLSLPLLTFLLPAVFLLIKSNPLILGWEPWVHQMFIKTSPATTPFGLNNLKFIQYNIRKKSSLNLRHSIYEEYKVIKDISDWVLKQRI